MLPADKQTDRITDNFFAIIVAGGSGRRMQAEVPKQFLLLNGKPILQHTIERFLEVLPADHIVVVLPARDRLRWDVLCREHGFDAPVQLVDGGATRFQSVQNGLNVLTLPDAESASGLVAVHDGVRPFVSRQIIQNSYETAARMGSAITCVPVNDSVRVVGADGISRAVDRSHYRFVQTPQTFRLDWFRRAFQSDEQPHFTDCASVLEWAGYLMTLIEGSYENIKITTPEDLRK